MKYSFSSLCKNVLLTMYGPSCVRIIVVFVSQYNYNKRLPLSNIFTYYDSPICHAASLTNSQKDTNQTIKFKLTNTQEMKLYKD